MVFTPEEFRVKTRRGHWNVYDRSLTHRFVMQRHDRTRQKQEEHDLQIRRAQQNGRIIRPPRYYAESYHIVFEYMGHRHDVLTVFDKNRAMAVTARLKACDEFMNNRARMGDGEVLNPAEQWSDQPGGLPAQA